jgi:D-tyrosyl-tRNA(Tyr) deacylase
VRLLLQRVSRAEVRVAGALAGRIGTGLLVLVGVGPADSEAVARAMARRITELRIFEDAEGRTNRSLSEIAGAVLAISQFTLYADTRRGRRPGFGRAAPPDLAEARYEAFVGELVTLGIPVETGRFGASMEVELINRGPFTIWLDSDES